MIETEEKLENLEVVKRNGKKVEFDGTKVALAIKKGFDSVTAEDAEEKKYTSKDIQKVYQAVIKKIAKEYLPNGKIKIEEVQDLIEDMLKKYNYDDVYENFSEYRKRRAAAREAFRDDKNMAKLQKKIEGLGLKSANEEDSKRENANIDGNSAMGTMLQFGSTISRAFTETYLMKKKFAEAHDNGDIHIHDMDFEAMGTTTCMQIDLNKLFKNGFSTGHGHLREPKDIMSYSALAAIAIQSDQNDQHGGQSIPAFDFYMAPGVLKTFKRQYKQAVYELLDFTDFISFVNMDKVEKEIDKLNSINVDVSCFEPIYKDSHEVKRIFEKAYETAYKKTNRMTYQAMEAFIHNLNTMHSRAGAQVPFSSINFGTDTSPEGRMVIKNFLLSVDAGLGKNETPIFPISIFKLRKGVNYETDDPNYDLFQLAISVAAKRLNPTFSFMDTSFNKPYGGDVAYMGCRTRVIANRRGPEITEGRGNLSFTTINLPRLAIKSERNIDTFYRLLDDLLDLVRDQLYHRYQVQANLKVRDLPFLMGQGLYLDSDKLASDDRIEEAIKHGTLGVGFIGLAETLTSLLGCHHAQSEEAQKLGEDIIGHMREKVDAMSDKYDLNYSFIATPAEGLSGRFIRMDRKEYGIIPGVTDKAYYTNSFHVPVSYPISAFEKMRLEGAYHKFTNGGHISYVEFASSPVHNLGAVEDVLRHMLECDCGYVGINFPIDYCEECGYTGIIDSDYCPVCERTLTQKYCRETCCTE